MKWGRTIAVLAVVGCTFTADAATYDRSTMRPVYQEKSLYRNIVVLEGPEFRCMAFGRFHGEQSCIELAQRDRLVLPYTKALFVAFYAAPKPRRILMIGLGGGAVPRAIRKVFPDVEIESVELDPAVAKVAGSYFGFSGDERSRVHIDDGRLFVRKQVRAGAKFDIILIDAFEKASIPEHMLTKEFLIEVKALLSPGGVVAANTFANGALQRYEAATYQAVFGDIFDVGVVTGNRIILAGRDGIPSPATMRSKAIALDQKTPAIGFTSGEILEKLRLQATSSARVLTDQYSPSNLLLQYEP